MSDNYARLRKLKIMFNGWSGYLTGKKQVFSLQGNAGNYTEETGALNHIILIILLTGLLKREKSIVNISMRKF